MMARRRKARAGFAKIVGLAAALVLAGVAAWFGYRYLTSHAREADQTRIIDVAADRIDPANEGRHVKVTGQLSSPASARDREFGTGSKAAMLFRKAEMLQWQEHCAGADCTYDKVWSATAIDSQKFHVAGHENPPQRLVSARFDAANIHLGAYEVDPALIEAQLKAVDHVVRAAELPPNLAATFSEHEGMLYAGGDAAHPEVGTVRVSFREVPLGAASLTGAQRGKHLTH